MTFYTVLSNIQFLRNIGKGSESLLTMAFIWNTTLSTRTRSEKYDNYAVSAPTSDDNIFFLRLPWVRGGHVEASNYLDLPRIESPRTNNTRVSSIFYW